MVFSSVCPALPELTSMNPKVPRELVYYSLVENSSLLRKTHPELNSIYRLAGENHAHPSRLSSGTGLTCTHVWELEQDPGLRKG